MKAKTDIYMWVLAIFTVTVLVGLAWFIWHLAAGLEWYYRLAWVFGLFGVGAAFTWASEHGFEAIPVKIINK